MNGMKLGAQEAMLNALKQMEQAVRSGQVAHIVVVGMQAGGAHALFSSGHPGVVADQAVVGALELAKAEITKRVLEAQEKPRGRIVPARPLDPAVKMQ